MSISKKVFGYKDGKEVYLYTLSNKTGQLKAEIITYGGIIKALEYNNVDVVLGRDTMDRYLNNSGFFGAIIGRNSNRIVGGEFMLNGKKYTLARNDNDVCNLHGGLEGFDKKVWDAEAVDGDEPKLILSLTSPDGEEGFPGTVNVRVTYTLTNENSIKIEYNGVADADTILNMTNHSYFNLNGHDSGVIDEHTVKINASFFTPNTDVCAPCGEVISVVGTPFDMRNGIVFKDGFKSDYKQIQMFGGYDHNFVLDGSGYRKFAEVKGDKTGIQMDCYTDLPGVQLYTGNCIEAEDQCKNGAAYDIHHAFCLETQAFPNAINISHFPSPILKKGKEYYTCTEYKFI